MMRATCKWIALGVCATAVALSFEPAAAGATYGWSFHNTDWYDFDVGGHVMCGVQYNQTPGLRPVTVICQFDGQAPQWPNSPNAAGIRAIAVDDDGRPWVLTSDSYIYRADTLPTAAAVSNNTWHYWHGPYGVVSGGCADQIAVTGSVAAGTTHVMLRGCTDHSAYVFVESQNNWMVTQTHVLEISTGGQPHLGTGSVFWQYSTATPRNEVMVYDPVRATSISLGTANGAAVVYPVDCYLSKSTFQVVAPGCTLGLSNSARHVGGHEIVLDGTWPATLPTDPPVSCSSSIYSDSSSPTGWEFTLGNEVPWFAQYTLSTSKVGGVLNYAHTYEPIGPRTVDLPNLVLPRSMPSISPWSYLLSHPTDLNWEVCGHLSPPDYGNWTLTAHGVVMPSILKVREGSLFGRAGGPVPSGSTDVLWILDDSARVYSYEGG